MVVSALVVIGVVAVAALVIGIVGTYRFYDEMARHLARAETLARKITGAEDRLESTATEIRRLRDIDFERGLRRSPFAETDNVEYRLRIAQSLDRLSDRIKHLEPKEPPAPPAPVAQTFDVAVTVTPRKEK